MNQSIILSFIICCVALSYTAQKKEATKIPGWQLDWADEFNYEGRPDTTIWDYDADVKNNNYELQYYTRRFPENVKVSNGLLTITASKENYKESNYTSARMVTRGKKDILYGRIEVCAQLPKGRGTWPAIWMLSSKLPRVYPDDGEIDIMEHVGYEEGIITGAAHVKRNTTGTEIISNTGTTAAQDATEKFHVYGLIWTPTRLEWQVDGKTFYFYDKADRPAHHWPFNKSFYLILNIAIGGTWGGKQGIDDSVFPQSMKIDYVRVYSKKN